MKRFTAYFLSLLILLSSTACGGESGSSGHDSEKATFKDSEISEPFESKNDNEQESSGYDSKEATFKDPEISELLESKKWGSIPVNQIALVFHDEVSRDSALSIIKKIGGSVAGEMGCINLYQIDITAETETELEATMDTARKMEGVELVFPNTPLALYDLEGKPCSPLNDPLFNDPRNAAPYRMIGMENAWRIIKGSGVTLNPVNMGMLDTAIGMGTDEFKGKVKLWGSLADIPIKDASGNILGKAMTHGTLVAHVIGADGEDNKGVTGIAGILGEKLNLHAKNLYDRHPEMMEVPRDTEDVTQGVCDIYGKVYAIKALAYLKDQVDGGATIINCSYGAISLKDDNEWVCKAYKKFFDYVHKKKPHVVFVVGAGNEGNADGSEGGLNGKNSFPAGIKAPNVITVGALNIDGSRASFASYAKTEDAELTISAPGVDMVLGVKADGTPVRASGSSYATPQVSATVALLQSINPRLSAKEIKEILKATSDTSVTTDGRNVNVPSSMGGGVLRVDKAVLAVINHLRTNRKPPLKAYTMDQLLAIGSVKLTAAGGPADYVLTARIDDALKSHTDVRLETTGSSTVTGDLVQKVALGSSARWSIRIGEEAVFVRVVRLDNNTCAYLTLESDLSNSSIAGAYEIIVTNQYGVFPGSMTLTPTTVTELYHSLPDAIPYSWSNDTLSFMFTSFMIIEGKSVKSNERYYSILLKRTAEGIVGEGTVNVLVFDVTGKNRTEMNFAEHITLRKKGD